MSGFINDREQDRSPVVFLQWKGTDACFDFYCGCGTHCHYDGGFAYVVKCPGCGDLWEMPCYLYPRPSQRDPDDGCVVEPRPDSPSESAPR